MPRDYLAVLFSRVRLVGNVYEWLSWGGISSNRANLLGVLAVSHVKLQLFLVGV